MTFMKFVVVCIFGPLAWIGILQVAMIKTFLTASTRSVIYGP